MKHFILALTACFVTQTANSDTFVNLKSGQWDNTTTVSIPGIPSQEQKNSYCLSVEDSQKSLEQFMADSTSEFGQDCQLTLLGQTEGHVDFQMACDMGGTKLSASVAVDYTPTQTRSVLTNMSGFPIAGASFEAVSNHSSDSCS